jgi:hypothetical protein
MFAIDFYDFLTQNVYFINVFVSIINVLIEKQKDDFYV